jgi:hypothetical protein
MAAVLVALVVIGNTQAVGRLKKTCGAQVVVEALVGILVLAVLELVAVSGRLAPVAVLVAVAVASLHSFSQAVER